MLVRLAIFHTVMQPYLERAGLLFVCFFCIVVACDIVFDLEVSMLGTPLR
jgi:hypothetical protein